MHSELQPSVEYAPGWYPDPAQPLTQRYWDGSEWTDYQAPIVAPPVADGRPSIGPVLRRIFFGSAG